MYVLLNISIDIVDIVDNQLKSGEFLVVRYEIFSGVKSGYTNVMLTRSRPRSSSDH